MDFLPPPISKETHDAIKNLGTEGASEPRNYTSNNAEAQGLLNRPSNFDQNLAFGNNAERDAIRSKYDKDFYLNQNKLNLNAKKSAEEDSIRKLSVASNLANEEIELNRKRELLAWQQRQAKKAARSQLIGNILGVSGGAAGFALGGGPVGAMAGMAGGQAVGGLLGGF